MEKIVLFLDHANINRAAGERGWRLDYADLLQYMGEGRLLLEAHGYVPINPRSEHRGDRDREELWRAGYLVHTRQGKVTGGTYHCNFAVEIAMDILKVLSQVRPDIIVLASGDADFLPLVQEARQAGVRVEVAAFPESAGAELRQRCSGFIDLAVYAQSYLAAQRGQEEARTDERYQDLIRLQQGTIEAHPADRAQDLMKVRQARSDKQVAVLYPAPVSPHTGKQKMAEPAEVDQEPLLPDLSELREEEAAHSADQPVSGSSVSMPASDFFAECDV
jgi:uncharacterized LabA/DUF88 family protein